MTTPKKPRLRFRLCPKETGLRALADGAALLVEGGVVVRTPGAP